MQSGTQSMARRRFKRVLLGSVLAALAFSFVPYTTTVCPQWTLQILDEHGVPVPYANVIQCWQFYSLESSEHKDDVCADPEGKVTFPRRPFTAAFTSRVAGALNEVFSLGVHASVGGSAYVIASGHGYDNHSVSYRSGQPPTTLQLTRHEADDRFPYRRRCP
jgi:hypothetical protein